MLRFFSNSDRFQLRRSALRLLSSSTTSSLRLLSKPRAISSLSASSIKSPRYPYTVSFQLRWATSQAEAEAKENEIEVKEEDHITQSETVPIHQAEASTEAEVENVLSQEEAVEQTDSTSAPVSEAAEVTEATAAGAEPLTNASPDNRYGGVPASPKPTVYVGNLFFDVTEEDLTKEFSRFGQVDLARIIRDARGLSKGFVRHHF